MGGAGSMAGMSTSADVELVAGRYADAQASGLVDLIQAEYVARYGSGDETPMDGAEFDPPNGRFLLAYLDSVPIACGGWRTHGPGQGEIKRMFVAEAGRRRGIAARLLAELERTAAEAGLHTMVLETGDAQPEAIGLYTGAGYVPTEKYGYYRCSPQSISLAKSL